MPEVPDFAAGGQILVPWPDGWVWTGLAGPDGNSSSRFTYDEWVQGLRDNAEARRAKADSGRPDDLDELRRRLEELRNTPCVDGETPARHTTTTGVIMSTRFRKLPIEIDAIQFTGTGESCTAVTEFFGGSSRGDNHKWKTCTNDGGWIVTLEGRMEFNPSDWIIRGVMGEYYPCRADIFAATYEPAGAVSAQPTYPGRPGDGWQDDEGAHWVLCADGKMRMLVETEEPEDPAELDARFGPMLPLDMNQEPSR